MPLYSIKQFLLPSVGVSYKIGSHTEPPGFFEVPCPPQVMQKNFVVRYLTASVEELRKVTWPTKEQVARLTVITIVFSLVMATIFGALDYGLSQGFNWLITKF